MRKAQASEVRSEFENILQQMRQAQGDAWAATEKNHKLLRSNTFCHGQVCEINETSRLPWFLCVFVMISSQGILVLSGYQ